MGMKVPPSCRKALTAAMEDAGISVPESEERWAAADEALIGVWASKFNDRAYYSMRKVGLNFMDLRMAVVVQRVVQARYAFVIHTNNPSTGTNIFSLAPAMCYVLVYPQCLNINKLHSQGSPSTCTVAPSQCTMVSVHHGVLCIAICSVEVAWLFAMCCPSRLNTHH